MKRLIGLVAAAGLLGAAAPALAHHSGAMFDRNKEVSIKGTVKEVEWINPHAWLDVVSDPDASGKTTQWSFEFGGGAGLLRGMGMTKERPAPGDKVTVEGYPLRDGRPGASFKRLVMADGTTFPRVAGPGSPTAQPTPNLPAGQR